MGCLESGRGQVCWPSTAQDTAADISPESEESATCHKSLVRESISSSCALLQLLHTLHIQFASNSHEDFQDGHETRHLTETAAADHLGVNQETLLVVPSLNAVGNFMKTHEDGWRELWGGSRNESACSALHHRCPSLHTFSSYSLHCVLTPPTPSSTVRKDSLLPPSICLSAYSKH